MHCTHLLRGPRRDRPKAASGCCRRPWSSTLRGLALCAAAGVAARFARSGGAPCAVQLQPTARPSSLAAARFALHICGHMRK
eukprot:scaffold17242_cov126-Isochrysis_galbana.AAC.9